jgi:hypothetical protein
MSFEFSSKLFPILVSQIRWFKEYYINIPEIHKYFENDYVF